MLISCFTDLIKFPKVDGIVSVNGWLDIHTVTAVLHHLQLLRTAHICKPRLDLCYIDFLCTLTFSASGFHLFQSCHQPDKQSL